MATRSGKKFIPSDSSEEEKIDNMEFEEATYLNIEEIEKDEMNGPEIDKDLEKKKDEELDREINIEQDVVEGNHTSEVQDRNQNFMQMCMQELKNMEIGIEITTTITEKNEKMIEIEDKEILKQTIETTSAIIKKKEDRGNNYRTFDKVFEGKTYRNNNVIRGRGGTQARGRGGYTGYVHNVNVIEQQNAINVVEEDSDEEASKEKNGPSQDTKPRGMYVSQQDFQ
ncbi:hypothetical protein RN001_004211 [Aquatica leii]|uniref:Uncharacterized protein n=1 Tax=Aquatica leii TaxID=1421715 RepID=A0AAN7SHB8_9COLE|nr:hypothetical protein RN001_004211 [Aquatica leii]